ncbi:MAG: hypothetical protein U0572_15125 [Phycisphaerales bacterium]
MNTSGRAALIAFGAALASTVAASGHAAVTTYPKNLAGFNAAAGNPPIALDFDSIAPNTDVTGLSFDGVTLMAPGAALIVVIGADTVTPIGFGGAPHPETNKLLPTSGANVLSPGGLTLGPGSNPAIENDDVKLVFDPPVSAVGIDHLSQSADGFGFTTVVVRNAANVVLFSGSVPISDLGGGGAPGGADFWGIVSTANDIASVTFDEQDDNAQFPDSNIGFDTLRFFPTPSCHGASDIDGDGDVDAADLGVLLGAWGTAQCPADIDENGVVDAADLAVLLGDWTG